MQVPNNKNDLEYKSVVCRFRLNKHSLLMVILDNFHTSPLENIWITVCIHLFILSLISERLVNFIKLNFQRIYEGALFSKKSQKKAKKVFGNFRDKGNSEKGEKLRERGILNWAILCSIAVALFTKADLFFILENGALPKNKINLNSNEISLLGIFMTAIFISLGSKFWHDLLDLLFQMKNLRSKLTDIYATEFNNIKELDEFINSLEADAIKKLVDDNRNHLMNYENVVSVGINNKFCEVFVTTINDKIPTNLLYFYPANKPKLLPIVQKLTTVVKTFMGPSNEIGSTITQNFSGTLGAVVKYLNSDDSYFLTCYHVLRSPEQLWEVFDGSITPNAFVEHPDGTNRKIGKIKEAKRTMRLDIAIVKFLDDIIINSEIPKIGEVYDYRSITYEDKNNTIVRKNGKTTGEKKGVIIDYGVSANIEYPDGNNHKLFNLIKIRASNSEEKFSKPGDSGSLVVDENNLAVGVIVAGNDNFSLAMPIDSIFTEFNLTF